MSSAPGPSFGGGYAPPSQRTVGVRSVVDQSPTDPNPDSQLVFANQPIHVAAIESGGQCDGVAVATVTRDEGAHVLALEMVEPAIAHDLERLVERDGRKIIGG